MKGGTSGCESINQNLAQGYYIIIRVQQEGLERWRIGYPDHDPTAPPQVESQQIASPTTTAYVAYPDNSI